MLPHRTRDSDEEDRSSDTVRQEPFRLSLESIDYPAGFYPDQAPVHLNYVCALNGVHAPRTDGSFTYCELGCGAGETTNILAASNPGGHFVGVDLSPTHIEQACRARDAGLIGNAEFLAADICNLDYAELPDFDYITLHGLYTWVAPEVQNAIGEFLSAKLKPGGIAYISYNTMPGWGAIEPMRRAFIRLAAKSGRRALGAVRAALDELEHLRKLDAPFFVENPSAARILSRLHGVDLRYVAHEYFAEHWQPLYFSEMHDRMSQLGLRFVGDGAVVENILEHSVPQEFFELLVAEPDRMSLEAQRDFLQNRLFRRDVYIKPDGRSHTDPELLLEDMLFGLTVSLEQVPNAIHVVGDTRLTFEGPWFDRMKHLLAYRALTGREICADPAFRKLPVADVLAGLKRLSIGGFLAPFARRESRPSREPAETIAIVSTFNTTRLDRVVSEGGGIVLASPVTGSAVALELLEAVLVCGLRTRDPVQWAEHEIERRNLAIRSEADGKPIEGAEERHTALEHALEQFCRVRLRKLAYLGIVTQGESAENTP